MSPSQIPDINPYQFSDDPGIGNFNNYFSLEQSRFINNAKRDMYTNIRNNNKEIIVRMTGKRLNALDAKGEQCDRFCFNRGNFRG
jgi:hypothetical protein